MAGRIIPIGTSELWYIPAEYHWYIVGEYAWCIVGEYPWRSVGECDWYIMGECHWYIIGCSVTGVRPAAKIQPGTVDHGAICDPQRTLANEAGRILKLVDGKIVTSKLDTGPFKKE